MKKGAYSILVASFLLLLMNSVWGEPAPRQIYYTKKVSSGTYTFKFSLWDAETEGTKVWEEEKTLKVTGGLIKTYLGDATSLDGVDFSQQYWIQVERMKNNEYILAGNREKLGVVPYALWSGNGPTGPQGPEGPQGPQGDAGPAGPCVGWPYHYRNNQPEDSAGLLSPLLLFLLVHRRGLATRCW